MSAQFFVVSDPEGNISCKPASEVVSRNAEAWTHPENARFDIVLAQADSQDQGERFVALLRNQRAA